MRRVLSQGAILAVVAAVLVWGCARTPTSPTPPKETKPTLRVLGPQAILVPGESAQLQAMKYENGGKTDLTTSAIWSSSDTSVVSVSAGLALAVAPGNADVSAMVDGLTSTIGFRVTASHVELTGRIEPEVAADMIAQNQDVPYNKHRGTITRFDLPIRVYVDPGFLVFDDCAQRAVKSWQSLTALPIVFIDKNTEPRIQMIVIPTDDNRARTVTDSVNLDNSQRGASLIMPTSWGWGCPDPYLNTVTHEFGHALGIMGHPDWGGVMAYLAPGVYLGLRQPSAREVRMLVELYKLPHGAHVEPDGTWVVR
jgi:hypothetical protein